MEYKIAMGRDIFAVQDAVNKAISEGYVPTGGLAVQQYQHSYGFYQAMIKHDKEVTNEDRYITNKA